MKRRKQKTSPASSALSRSEIFLHRTRSGHARPDPIAKSPSGTSDEPLAGGDGADDGSFHTSIKDLRSRRVFSPTSISVEGPPDGSAKIGAQVLCFPVKDELTHVGADDFECSPDRVCLMEEVSEENEVVGEQGNGGGNDEMSQKVDRLKEECSQSMPPEGDSLSKTGMEVEFDNSISDRLVGDPGENSDEQICGKEKGLSEQSHGRLGLVPFSQLRLFQNPNSFSYRRLLPFLVDLTKNNSSSLEIVHCQLRPTKVEKPVAEKVLPILLASPPCTKMDESPGGCKSANFRASQMDQIRENQDLLLQLDKNTKIPMTHPTQNNSLDSKIIFPGISSESAEPSPKINASEEFEFICKSSYSPPDTREALTVEEIMGCVKSPSSSRKAEDQGMISPSVLAFGPEGRLAFSPGKGILKRQRVECIGFCACMDCVSFRLCAERGFAFSRKQMQEAEDITMGLIQELSCLRKLVDRSVPEVGAADHCILQLNQVEGVCRRASRIEELAKQLKQMIAEIDIHCRSIGQG